MSLLFYPFHCWIFLHPSALQLPNTQFDKYLSSFAPFTVEMAHSLPVATSSYLRLVRFKMESRHLSILYWPCLIIGTLVVLFFGWWCFRICPFVWILLSYCFLVLLFLTPVTLLFFNSIVLMSICPLKHILSSDSLSSTDSLVLLFSSYVVIDLQGEKWDPTDAISYVVFTFFLQGTLLLIAAILL